MDLYKVRGFRKKKMEKIESDKSPFEWLYEYRPAQVPIDKTYTKARIEPFKANLEYFLAGNLKDATRSNKNLLSKQLIVLDYDNIPLKAEEFTNKVMEQLKGVSFILYPTISNNIEGVRFRLVIDTDRAYTESENKRLITNVAEYIGIPCDIASQTYSQLMGLPVLNKLSSPDLIVKQRGKALQVDTFLFEPEKLETPASNKKEEGDRLTHETAVSMVQAYADRVGDRLLERAYYLNPYLNIKYAYEQGEIDLDTVEACLTVLARGNGDWAEANFKHFKSDSTPVVSGTPFTQFFGWAYEDFSDFEEGGQKNLLSGKALQNALMKRRREELERLTREWEMAGGKGKPPAVLTPLTCAGILKEYVAFCLFDMNEHTRLAMYQPEKGIYTQGETQILRIIGWLEPTFNERKARDVIYHLWRTVEIRQRTVSRHLIPVDNGVFNLKTKKLEAFTPDYVFTSKIATAYNDSPALPDCDGWNVEKWMLDIACNDREVASLLWEVISDAINGNYSRKQSVWLIGEGSNGKGTFQQLLYNLIGNENIATLKINQFKERFKLALLVGKVAVIGDDVGAGIYIDDSSEFNSLVTGETILIEEKNRMPYSVKLYVTVIQSTNGMPRIKNKTHGTYRRLLLVPFNATFDGVGDDWRIKDDYIQREEVLQYVLHKAVNMDFERFTIPKASKKLLEEYKQENDPLQDFKKSIFDELSLVKIPLYVIYELYKAFCLENGYSSLSKIKFSRSFEKLLGSGWDNKKAKYKKGDIGKLKLEDLNEFNIFIENPQMNYPYQSFVKNDLQLLADVVEEDKEKRTS